MSQSEILSLQRFNEFTALLVVVPLSDIYCLNPAQFAHSAPTVITLWKPVLTLAE